MKADLSDIVTRAGIAICALILAALITIGIDYLFAKPSWQSATVTGKWVKPAWEELHTDSNGHVSIEHHEPEYYVTMFTDRGRGAVHCWERTYWQFAEGDTCQVEFRTGKLFNYSFTNVRKPQ